MDKTKILVDADACPVKEIIVEIGKEFDLKVIMFIDTSHIYEDDYSTVIQVEQRKDAVDIALINKTCKGDIVVTQDYGVAAMALGKGAYPINQNGMFYSNKNINKLLLKRHTFQKTRRAGGIKSLIPGKEEWKSTEDSGNPSENFVEKN